MRDKYLRIYRPGEGRIGRYGPGGRRDEEGRQNKTDLCNTLMHRHYIKIGLKWQVKDIIN